MSEKKVLKLSFLDLETTGLDEERCDITEIALIPVTVIPGPDWVNTWTERERFEVKTLPRIPYVEPFVARLNGYDMETWMREGKPLHQVLGDVYGLLEDSIILGSNPGFDKGFLAKAFEGLGWNFPRLRSHHMIDVPSMAAPLLLTGQVSKIRQSTVGEALKVANREEHRAMADAEQCLALFYHMAQHGLVPSVLAGE